MALTNRARTGVKKPGKKMPVKGEILALGFGGVILLVILCLMAARSCSNARDEAQRKADIRRDAEYKRQTDEQAAEYLRKRNEPYQSPAPGHASSADYGSAMGHMIAMMGKAYPTDAEIEQMAKTKAVDAGHRSDNPIFIRSFKAAFAEGYAEGRRKYNAR